MCAMLSVATREALDDAYDAFACSDIALACRTLDDAVAAAAQARRDVEDVFALCCVRASLAAMEGGGGSTIASLMSPAREATQHAAATCYLEGLAALAKANLQTARVKFSEARRRDRLFVLAALGLAVVHFELRQYRESFAHYREVMSVLGSRATPAVVRVGMALCYYHLGRLDMAEQCLERALALDAHDQLALLALLVVYVDRRRFSLVADVVLRLRQLLPHNPLVLLRVGDLVYFKAVGQKTQQQQQQEQLQQEQQQAGDVAAMARALTTLLDEVRRCGSAEECAMADFQHGRMLLLCGDVAGATRRLEAALHTLPTLLAARVHYARVLLLSGRVEDGLRLLTKLHREHVSQKEVLQLLAVHATRLGRHAAALRYCRRLTESVAPDDVRAWALSAWCARLDHDACGRLSRHVVRLHRELQLTPSWQLLANVAVLSRDAEALQGLLDRELGGDFLRASDGSGSSNNNGNSNNNGTATTTPTNTTTTARPLEVRHVPLIYNLALLLEQRDKTRARQLYLYLVKQQSCFRAPYFRLHALACADGLEQQAVAWLTLLLQLAPDEATALAGIAERFFRHARYRAAMDILRNTRNNNNDNENGGGGEAAAGASGIGRRRGRDERDAAALRTRRSPAVSLALAATYLWCAQRRGRDDRRFLATAKERYVYVLRHDRGNVLAAHGLACCLALEGDYDHCQSLLSRVGEVTPNASYVTAQQHVHMANAKMLSESYRQAIDHLARAAPLTPQQRSLQAFCLAAEGQLDEACELLARTIDEQQQASNNSNNSSNSTSEAADVGKTHAQLQQQALQHHLAYNVALLHCTAFVRHVAHSELLTLAQGRALRDRLERGLAYAVRFLRSSSSSTSSGSSVAAGQSSSVTRVCRVFIKSVCAYCVHVYETTLERLLLAGKESEAEQSREAQRWADTYAAYCAERNKDAEARAQQQAQQQQLQRDLGREVLDGFRARREHDPLKLFDADLVAASLAELDRQTRQPLPGMTDDNDNNNDSNNNNNDNNDVQKTTSHDTADTGDVQTTIEDADATAHTMLAGMLLTTTATTNDEGIDDDDDDDDVAGGDDGGDHDAMHA